MSRRLPVAIGLIALSISACAGKTKPAPTTPPPTVAKAPEPSPPKPAIEVAKGDLREILLHLRRVHFPFDSSILGPAARDALANAAEKLQQHPEVELYVEGYTDERGTTEYNVALGERRAWSVVDYLTLLGVDRRRLHPISYGEERPLSLGASARAMAENRRVDFRLMRGNVQLVLDEGVLLDDSGTPMAKSQASRMR